MAQLPLSVVREMEYRAWICEHSASASKFSAATPQESKRTKSAFIGNEQECRKHQPTTTNGRNDTICWHMAGMAYKSFTVTLDRLDEDTS